MDYIQENIKNTKIRKKIKKRNKTKFDQGLVVHDHEWDCSITLVNHITNTFYKQFTNKTKTQPLKICKFLGELIKEQ